MQSHIRACGARIAVWALFTSSLGSLHAGIDQHTVAVWLFNEGEGATVRDASGNGHEGTFEGSLSWTEAVFGGGLAFPGDGSGYVAVESTDDLLLEELTIEAWVNVEESTAKWQGIICKQQAGCTNRNYGIWVEVDQSVLHAQIGFGGGCDFQADGTTVITDNQWHHLAFTYDGDMGRLYVDGVLETEQPYAKPPFQSGDPITIGVPNIANANGLLGVIDEARISSIARTEGELQEAMRLGLDALLGVEAPGKLTSTWASLKSSR